MGGFGDTQAGRVTGRQDRAMIETFHGFEEVHDLLGAEYDGQMLWGLGVRDAMINIPVTSQSRPV